jgi:hypothetical protein
MDHVPRQHEVEAVGVKRKFVRRSLAHAEQHAAPLCGLAKERKTGSAAVDRLDRQPVLGEEQRVSADAATEIAVRAPLAFNSGKRPSVEPARSFASR